MALSDPPGALQKEAQTPVPCSGSIRLASPDWILLLGLAGLSSAGPLV